jgi:hypothetical protein
MLKPSEKTFIESVEGIGPFKFRYPTILDEIAIDAKTSQILAGNDRPSVYATNLAYMIATLSVVVVQAPPGWKLEEIYRVEDAEVVHRGYLQRIKEFRGEDEADSSETGNPGGEELSLLVSPEVQPAAQ